MRERDERFEKLAMRTVESLTLSRFMVFFSRLFCLSSHPSIYSSIYPSIHEAVLSGDGINNLMSATH